MKNFLFLATLLLSLASPASAQNAIRFNQLYTLNAADEKPCKLQLKVTAKPRMQATIIVGSRSYKGIMTQNKENGGLFYNCYVTIKGSKKLLMLEFSKEDDCYKASIINQDYLSIFKPCPDEKYMMLESCN